MLTSRPGVRIGLLAGVGTAALIALLLLSGEGGLWTAPRMLRCLAGFCLGTLVWATVAWAPWRISVRMTDLVFVLLLLLLWILLASVDNRTPANVLALTLFAAVIWLAANDMGSYSRRILEATPLVTLGKLSYSIYMVHFMLATIIGVLLERGAFPRVDVGNINHLSVLPGIWGDVLLFGYLVAVVALSAATYVGIERPWRATGLRLATLRTNNASIAVPP